MSVPVHVPVHVHVPVPAQFTPARTRPAAALRSAVAPTEAWDEEVAWQRELMVLRNSGRSSWSASYALAGATPGASLPITAWTCA